MAASAGNTTEGRPLAILAQNDRTGRYELDEEALASVMMAPEVRNKRVCVLSVAGAFRKGKSFLLDFFLRYCQSENKTDWLGDSYQPLRGFKWRYGRKRETAGLLVWSKPFIVTDFSGQQIAVILMDSEGTFDTERTLQDSATVFGLAVLMSSVLVYNVSHIIQEDDLMNLQTFTSYGIVARNACGSFDPFQKLMFLVRDCEMPGEFSYGAEGGQAILDDILEIEEQQPPDHQEVRKDIHRCFTEMSCFLMPHPGNKIRDPGFDGNIRGLDVEFKEQLQALASQLLAPDNLVQKKLAGRPVTAEELFHYFSSLARDVLAAGNIELTTLVESNARASCISAMEFARKQYSDSLDSHLGIVPPNPAQQQEAGSDYQKEQRYLETVELTSLHNTEKRQALDCYQERNVYGRMSEATLDNYRRHLEQDIDQLYLMCVRLNDYRKRLAELKKNSEEQNRITRKELEKTIYSAALDLYKRTRPWTHKI